MSAARPTHPLRLDRLLGASWAILRAHPVIGAGLGGAVLLSLASSLFGVGIVSTPWFVCELFAAQLAILGIRPAPRGSAWLRAGLLVLALVGLVAAATWLAALALGPDVTTADQAAAPLPWPDAARRVASIAAVTALAVGFIAPFVYAPIILLERGGQVGAAVLESAWLVRRGGLARHWALAFLAHLLPLAPALVAAVVVARTFERAATPVGALVGLPLLPFTIPLGQGLVAAAYAAQRRELAEPRWTRAEGRPPRALVAAMVAVVLAPMTAVGLLALGAARPTAPSDGPARGAEVAARAVERPTTIHVPGTTLVVRATPAGAVRVEAGDGGGLGAVPGPRRPIDAIRVRRRGDVYGVELRGPEGVRHVEVDRAAIRVDDAVGRRLARRVPDVGLFAIGLAFGLTALLMGRALAPLGALRRAYGAPISARRPRAELEALRAAAIRTAWRVTLALTPTAVLSLVAGGLAVLG